ncbi:MAG: nitrite transporter NirC [Burkholderiales bacterium]|mgnify:CR=1 FL=1
MAGEIFGSDAFSPREVAARIETIGVAKARLPLRSMSMLALLAGAFIGLGSIAFLLVASDPSLSFATSRVLGGVVFSLGLIMVVVAGAELFTGNNLLAMAWAEGKLGTRDLLRNWVVVCLGNFAGATGLAVLVLLADTGSLNGGLVAKKAVEVAAAKAALPWDVAFARGALCNVLVCLAVWMAAAGRSVVDKAVAIVPPIAAFVALGFEHSIANMFFFPLAIFLLAGDPTLLALPGAGSIGWLAMIRNLVPVIAGNLVGGSVLVALVYWVIYLRKR